MTTADPPQDSLQITYPKEYSTIETVVRHKFIDIIKPLDTVAIGESVEINIPVNGLGKEKLHFFLVSDKGEKKLKPNFLEGNIYRLEFKSSKIILPLEIRTSENLLLAKNMFLGNTNYNWFVNIH